MRKFFFLIAMSVLYAHSYAQVDTSKFLNKIYSYGGGNSLPYRLFVPKNYNSSIEYPLVMFLHGAGECGVNNTSPLKGTKYSATYYAQDSIQAKHPCFVLVPQCANASEQGWCRAPKMSSTIWLRTYNMDTVPASTSLLAAMNLIKSLKTTYNLDTTRYYITGVSLGGFGTWEAIIRYPTFFAKAIPMSGAGDPSRAKIIKDIPIRIFHEKGDGIVSVQGSIDMDSALKAVNADDEALIDPEGGCHCDGGWLKFYATKGITEWLFSHKSLFSVSTDSIELNYALNSSSSFQIKSDTTWKISCDQKWLALSSASGSLEHVINIQAQENIGVENRIAILTIYGNRGINKTIKVTQLGKPISISSNEADNVEIYPNPVNEKFHISGLEAKTRILFFSLNGSLINEYIALNNEIEINSAQFMRGVYLVKLITPFSTKNYTVIKK
jgi:poly(3-hydroxybutyrate) depolymerase